MSQDIVTVNHYKSWSHHRYQITTAPLDRREKDLETKLRKQIHFFMQRFIDLSIDVLLLALVRQSVIISCEGMRFIATSLFVLRSRNHLIFISRCLVFEHDPKLDTSSIRPFLSTLNTVGFNLMSRISSIKCLSHMFSCAPSVRAFGLASVEDMVIFLCFLLFQEIGQPLHIGITPDLDSLVLSSSAQVASV